MATFQHITQLAPGTPYAFSWLPTRLVTKLTLLPFYQMFFGYVFPTLNVE